MGFAVVYKSASTGKLVPVKMGKPGNPNKMRIPDNAKITVVDEETGKVVEQVSRTENGTDIVITAQQNGHTGVVVIEGGHSGGAVLLDSAAASAEFGNDFGALMADVSSGSQASMVPFYLAGAAGLGGGVAALLHSPDRTPPVFTSGDKGKTITENTAAGAEVYVAQATDNGKGKITYSLKAGSDAGLRIDPATGRVTLANSPDYEVQSNYNFVVIATDEAGNTEQQVVSFSVANRDEAAPTITSAASAGAIAEGSGAGQVVYTAAATDADFVAPATASSITYSLKAGSDAGLAIDAQTGAVTLAANPDYETKASYGFTVVATDAAGNASEKAVTLAVTNRDEVAPAITSANSAAAIAENSGAGQIVYTAAATDTDFVAPATASSITYSLKAGSDAGLAIDAQTGAVTLAANPDYETKASYSFTVVATDAAGNASEKAVTLAIGDLDEAPFAAEVLMGGDAVISFAEKTIAAALTVNATKPVAQVTIIGVDANGNALETNATLQPNGTYTFDATQFAGLDVTVRTTDAASATFMSMLEIDTSTVDLRTNRGASFLQLDFGEGDRDGDGDVDDDDWTDRDGDGSGRTEGVDGPDGDETFDDPIAMNQIRIGDRVKGLLEIPEFVPGQTQISVPDTFLELGSDDEIDAEQFEVYYGTYANGIFTITSTPHTTDDVTGATHTMILYDNDPRPAGTEGTVQEEGADIVGGLVFEGVYREENWSVSDAGTDQARLVYQEPQTSDSRLVFAMGEGYSIPRYDIVDGGNGVFDGVDGQGDPLGDDAIYSTTPGDPGYVDFATQAVTVKILGISDLSPLDITGFNEDDRIEIDLSVNTGLWGDEYDYGVFEGMRWSVYANNLTAMAPGDPNAGQIVANGDWRGLANFANPSHGATLSKLLQLNIANLFDMSGIGALQLRYRESYSASRIVSRPLLRWSTSGTIDAASLASQITVIWPTMNGMG